LHRVILYWHWWWHLSSILWSYYHRKIQPFCKSRLFVFWQRCHSIVGWYRLAV